MNRRTFLQGMAAGGTLAALGAAGQGSKRAARPNVIIILADDLGYGDVGCYGATKVPTPNIDRLAREGRRFTDAHSPCAVCTPTRYGMLTGREYWRRKGKFDHQYLLGDAKLTLPRLFKEAGYATACVGKWHLGFGETEPDWNGDLKPGPLEAGFDYYFGTPRAHNEPPHVLIENYRVVGLDPADPIAVSKPDAKAMFGVMTGGAKAKFNPAELAVRSLPKAVEFIERSKDGPFFLYLATNNVHGPITPHARFRGKSQAGVYGDYIVELDWMVGEVMAALERLGLTEKTLIVFSSDNGGVNGKQPIGAGHYPNGALLGQKTDAWEGGHRVPFIARWPGSVPAGTVGGEMLSLADMMATCAALLGREVKREDAPDSFNQLPALLGKKEGKPTRTYMTIQGVFGMGIREGKWMLIPQHGSAGFSTDWPAQAWLKPWQVGRATSDYTADGKLKPEAPQGQLYDLEADPNETTNVYEKHPEIVKRLTEKLNELRAEAGRPG